MMVWHAGYIVALFIYFYIYLQFTVYNLQFTVVCTTGTTQHTAHSDDALATIRMVHMILDMKNVERSCTTVQVHVCV